MKRILAATLLSICVSGLVHGQVSDEEFVGPFATWTNVQTTYGKDGSALQSGLNDIGKPGHSSTLYLPAGTYCVQPLVLATRIGINIIGENPATTVIKYCGPESGVLLYVNGVAYSRFSRLTFDCAGVGSVGVDQSSDGLHPYFDTGNEYSDVVFRNCPIDIRGGNQGHGFAETSVVRAHFGPSGGPCVILKNFNALDLWIWYSLFDHCQVGVTNNPGAGNFNVYNSVFRKSIKADLSINNTGGFNVRNNTSIGSNAFWITTRAFSYPAQITIQGNTLIDTEGPAVILGNQGPAFVVDNRIRSATHATGPVIVADDLKDSDLLTLGNSFSSKEAVSAKGRYIGVDDRTGAHLDLREPVLPGTPPNLHRRIFEVPKGSDGVAIQMAIDAAAASHERRAVVHIPEGSFQIKSTLNLPRGTDIQVIGDGYQVTRLTWLGPGPGPVFHVPGPSHVQFRELFVSGGNGADGFAIDGVDQAGSRVYLQETQLRAGKSASLLVDQLDNTNVDLRDVGHGGSPGVAIKVVGGKEATAGHPLSGRTNVFSGASDSNEISYELSGGGRLLVRDMWYETGKLPGYVRLTGSGTFTLHGARVALPGAGNPPAADLSDFHGTATFLETAFDGRINTSGNGSGSKVLVLGLLGAPGIPNLFAGNAVPPGQAAVINARSQFRGGSSNPVPNQGVADPAFLREMLKQTRAEQPQAIGKLPDGVSDVRLYRVWVGDSAVGIHLLP